MEKPLAKKPGENPQSSKSVISLHIQTAAGAEWPETRGAEVTGWGKSEMMPGWGIRFGNEVSEGRRAGGFAAQDQAICKPAELRLPGTSTWWFSECGTFSQVKSVPLASPAWLMQSTAVYSQRAGIL